VKILNDPKLAITLLHDWSFLYFRDRNFAKGAPPHYYVVAPVSGDELLLCIITSQVAKRRQHHHGDSRRIAALVGLNTGAYAFIRTSSVVDCNYAELLTKKELLARIDPVSTFRRESDHPSDQLRKDIRRAISVSPMISDLIRKAV
jgi:hypothetical protein